MTIVQVRGSFGSGKTTLVRRVMKRFEEELGFVKKPVFRDGRKRELYYLFEKPGEPALAVLGHYATATGGCDNLPDKEFCYHLAHELADKSHRVLMEGQLIAADVGYIVQTKSKGFLIHVVDLDVSHEECGAGIRARRLEYGINREWTEKTHKHIVAKARGVELARRRLTNDHEIPVKLLGREEAYRYVLELLS